jgi:hypothetical protein
MDRTVRRNIYGDVGLRLRLLVRRHLADQRQPAIQPSFGYETPTVSDKVLLSTYVSAWGSNVNFTNTGPTVEIDLMSGLRLTLGSSTTTISARRPIYSTTTPKTYGTLGNQ